VFAAWLLHLSPWAVPLLVGLAVLAAVYAVALIFFLSEMLLRPVLDDIGTAGAPGSGSAGQLSAPLLWRMLATLPAISIISGVVSAGLSKGAQSGVDSFALAVAVAIGVACTLALALSVLLAGSIAIPVRRLSEATERVAEGDLRVRVPVISTDETAELADSFNRMVAGLEERERLREAFGTFVDPGLAERVAREGTDLAGEEVEVSILFLDVRGFTSFSERADAKAVVAKLNELYEQVVPIVLRHGGHANKFIGDGLLAVFGAPERLVDHAERAVRAGLEIARAVAEAYQGELRVGIGVNSGRVLVGTIGGGGRLDFTVIGDTVNTASRVESATRQTDDDMLITETTLSQISEDGVRWVERPPVPLKGKEQVVRLYAPG
jgi:class 3 adenylate cyclase